MNTKSCWWLVAVVALTLGLGMGAGAAEAVKPAVTVSAQSVTSTTPANPKWFNGNWLGIVNYGGPNTSGWQPYVEITAQKAAYATAKANKDIEGMLASSFYTSAQIWVLNNAGHREIQKAEHMGTATDEGRVVLQKAKDYLERALAIPLPVLATDRPELIKEARYRGVAIEHAKKNLLFTERALGLKAWPAPGLASHGATTADDGDLEVQ